MTHLEKIFKVLVPPEIYCQSKQIDNRPSPSFPLEPPKIRVKSGDRGFARQNIESPVSKGKIHSGSISQKKMLSSMSKFSSTRRSDMKLTRKRQSRRVSVYAEPPQHP